MKFSEYLKAVKARLATPDGAVAPGGSINPHPLCYANGDTMIELQVAARQAKDKVAEEEAGDHFDRLNRAISSAIHEINRQLPEYRQHCMYPAAVYALAVHRGEPNPPPPTREWGQKLRHELLDTWIAEAEQRESIDV